MKFVFHFVLKNLDEFLINDVWDNVEDISDEFLDVPHHKLISQNFWLKKRKRSTSERVELSFKKIISNKKNILIYEEVPEEKFSKEINSAIKECQAFATIQFTRFTEGNIKSSVVSGKNLSLDSLNFVSTIQCQSVSRQLRLTSSSVHLNCKIHTYYLQCEGLI